MTDISVPKIGVEDGEVVIESWEFEPGDHVAAGSVVAQATTDKVNFEIEAPADGYLTITVPSGSTTWMTAVIGQLTDTPAPAADSPAAESPPDNEVGDGSVVGPEPVAETERSGERDAGELPVVAGVARLASPAARAAARASGLAIDDPQLTGSGPAGALLARDVSPRRTDSPLPEPSASAVDVAGAAPQRSRMSPLRRAIVRNMSESHAAKARLTMFCECVVDDLVVLRRQLNEQSIFATKVSYLDFYVRAAARALVKVPILNATIDGDDIVHPAAPAISVAVSVEGGLVTPVVREPVGSSFGAMHDEIDRLVSSARAGTLAPAELSGGTFTVSNTGSYGSLWGTPIINGAQSAIISTGIVDKRPVVNDEGEIAAASVLHFSLSMDHRIIDGADGGAWVEAFKSELRSPLGLLA